MNESITVNLEETDLSEESKKHVPPYAWIILVVVFLAGVAAPLNQFKVPPLLPILMGDFSLSLSQGGLLMSVFALTGLILSLPSAVIIQKLGLKTTGLIAMGSVVAGALLGIYAENISMLLLSRFIEGIGMGLIAVVGPTTIAEWFPRAKQGFPMGVWATWSSVGGLIMYNTAPRLESVAGWHSVWWFGAGFAGLAFILFAIFMRKPEHNENLEAEAEMLHPFSGFMDTCKNLNVWLLALMFGCFVFVFSAFASFLPTFLSEEKGFSLQAAALVASLPTIVNLGTGPFAGWFSDRIGSRKLIYSIPFSIIAVLFIFPFHLSGALIPYLLILMGFMLGAIPTAIFASVPEVIKNNQKTSIGIGVLILGQNLGMFLGPVFFGSLVEATNWIVAGYMLVPVCVLGVVAGLFVNVR